LRRHPLTQKKSKKAENLVSFGFSVLLIVQLQHYKQSVTTLRIEGSHTVGDRSPLVAALVVRRGSNGGSTLPLVVVVGEGAPSEQRALHVLWRWPSHGSEGVPSSSDIRLVGVERGADPALGGSHPVASALPWTTLASGVEIGLPDGSRDSWWSVWPDDGGATPGGSGEESH
jgi:hypothetical protein